MVTMSENITLGIAMWGAITGTLALWLRWIQHQRETAKLKCSASFLWEMRSDIPNPNFRIIIRSMGKRPITIDYIQYFIRPSSFKHRIALRWKWSQGKLSYPDRSFNHNQNTLTDGRKLECKIEIPNGLNLSSIAKVHVFDEAGKCWKVRWPNTSTRKQLGKYSELHSDRIESNSRWCEIRGFKVGCEFWIGLKWPNSPVGATSSHMSSCLKFPTKKKFAAKLESLKKNEISEFLAGNQERPL